MNDRGRAAVRAALGESVSSLPTVPSNITDYAAQNLTFDLLEPIKRGRIDPEAAEAWAEEAMRRFGWKGERTIPRNADPRVTAFANVLNAARKAKAKKANVATRQARADVVAKAVASGAWPDGRPAPKLGDEVEQVNRGFGGVPVSLYGIVVKKGSAYHVQIGGGASMFGGPLTTRKTVPLDPSWKPAK